MNRTEFANNICGVKLMTMAVLGSLPDWDALQPLLVDCDVAVTYESPEVVAQQPVVMACSGVSFICVGDGRVESNPTSNDDDAGLLPKNVHVLNRSEIDLGIIRLGGASLTLSPTGSHDPAIGRATAPSTKEVVTFCTDAEWLADVEERHPGDGRLYVLVIRGGQSSLQNPETPTGVRETLHSIGRRIQPLLRGGLRVDATLKARNERVLRRVGSYASILIDQHSITLPKTPLLPDVVSGRALLGARQQVFEKPTTWLTKFCIGDALYTTARRFPGNASEAPVTAHLRSNVLAWCNVVLLVTRYATLIGHQFAIETLPLEAIGTYDSILVGTFVEGIDDALASHIRSELNQAIRKTRYFGLASVHVAGVDRLTEVKAFVRTLSVDAIEAIHAVISGDESFLDETLTLPDSGSALQEEPASIQPEAEPEVAPEESVA
ncbi:hypothetical protein WN982_40015 [Paraburkholderia sp. IMGN_8]|uniref:hypothetical protein n=1 Tax=Paraburkholderia sp. IMGN_8 TaxID=3136564 RepID=UPI00310110F6